jgi:hypothetical protein
LYIIKDIIYDICTLLPLLGRIFRDFANKCFTAKDIVNLAKKEPLTPKRRSKPIIENFLEELVNIGIFKKVENFGRSAYYTIVPNEIHLIPPPESIIDQPIVITKGKGFRFDIYKNIEKEIKIGNPFNHVPIPIEGAKILTYHYKTCSAIIINETITLKINKGNCEFERRATLYQLDECQQIPIPLLYMNLKEYKENPKIKINNKYINNIEGLEIFKDGIDDPNFIIDSSGELKLSRGYITFKYKGKDEKDTIIGSEYKLIIEGIGKLPVCRKRENNLVTCIPFTITHETNIIVKIDSSLKCKLDSSCEIMSVNGVTSPFEVNPSEGKELKPLNKKFEDLGQHNGWKCYRLTLRYNDGDINHELFKSIRETGAGLLRIHIKDVENDTEFYICSKKGICNFRNDCLKL